MMNDTTSGKEDRMSTSSTHPPVTVHIRESGNASTNVVGFQDSSLPSSERTVQEEHRELRRQISDIYAMLQQLSHPVPPQTPAPVATVSPSRTPASRSSPPLPDIPVSTRVLSTVARPLFRDPLPAPSVEALPVAQQALGAPPATHHHVRSTRKVPAPKEFSGTSKDKAQARIWLHAARRWLALTAEDEPDHVRVDMFATLLQGSAQTWFTNMQMRAEQKRTPLTLQAVFDAFVKTYEGGLSQKMAEHKLGRSSMGRATARISLP